MTGRCPHGQPPSCPLCARQAALFASLADVAFWCEHCHGQHPLREHAACRSTAARKTITEEDDQ